MATFVVALALAGAEVPVPRQLTDAEAAAVAQRLLAPLLEKDKVEATVESVGPVTVPCTATGLATLPARRVTLSAGGKSHVVDVSAEARLCAAGGPPAAGGRRSGLAVAGMDAAAIAAARADLARRLKVPETDVVTVGARAVQWPDASLGCPQPDQMYAQVVTPGFEIVFRVGEKRYAYHGGRSRPATYCANPQPPVGGTGPVEK